MIEAYKTRAAREALQAQQYAELDKRTPEREMTMKDSQRMLCKTCLKYANIVIGGYGFSRPDPWKLYRCDCKYKYVWVKTITEE